MSDALLYRFRAAAAADMPGIARVRFSVDENVATPAQLAERGITNESVAASFLYDAKGWVAIQRDEIVGFSIADRAAGSIFALFVLPEHQGRGIGSQLLDAALTWLWDSGVERAWLTTGPRTKAADFYKRRGWERAGTDPFGDICFELNRPKREG